ncbi:hypothetical protein [Candidatus Poriferisocius sp.]|uniref:hypothetical protein n=1 Tax=Candidatus Poriferisocius sp. TaxID=3101276 RepID=UPI003B017D10
MTRRNTHFLKRNFFLFLISLIIAILLAGCGDDGSNSSSIVFKSGEFEIEHGGKVSNDPEIVAAVNQAIKRYTEPPKTSGCVDLATWYADGLEIIFTGELVQMVEQDISTHTGSQVIPLVSGTLQDVMIEVLKENPTLCPRNDDIRDTSMAQTIPELGPIAQKANDLLEARGGHYSPDPMNVLSTAIDIAEGRPLVLELHGFIDE